jgi:hypothetical protein
MGDTPTRTCTHCGATAERHDSRFCTYCGTELPRPAEPAPIVVSRHGDVEARFEALERRPELASAGSHRPSTAKHSLGAAGGIVGAGMFVVVAAVMTMGFAGVAGPCAIAPLAFVGIGIALLVHQVSRGVKFTQAPLRHEPALVVDERMKVSGGGESQARTQYFVSLQKRDGGRREFEADARLAGALTEGDMGVAWFKADVLVDFKRLPV